MRKRFKGFTLVEIMIVVLIIGLLIMIALPNFITARRNSQTNTCKANVKQIYGAIELAHMQGTNISATSELIGLGLLKSEPKCPYNGGTYTIVDPGLSTATISNCPYYDAAMHPAAL